MTLRMTWLAAGALLLCAPAVDGGAGAEPLSNGLTDAFIRFCGSTSGDGARALQLADTDGWSALPPWMREMKVPSFGPAVDWTRREGRWTQSRGVRRVLVIGTIRNPDGKQSLSCGVTEMTPPGMQADTAAMRSALQQWVGGAPVRSEGGFAEFVYRESAGRRTPLPLSQDPLASDAPTPPDVAWITLHNLPTNVSIEYARSR